MSSLLLCVGDQPELLQSRKKDLEQLGFEVVNATSSADAVSALERTEVTAVLLEYQPEGLDAEILASEIKQRFPQQPVILICPYADIPERVLWLVDEFMMRSEPLEVLLEIVDRVIALQHLRKRGAAA